MLVDLPGDRSIACESVCSLESLEGAVFVSCDSRSESEWPNPQPTFTVFYETNDPGVCELIGIGSIEDSEADAVEARDPFLSRKPEITVFRLNHIRSRILRKTVR